MSLSNYEKHEKLGEGSYGIVYKASDRRDDTIVALKILKLESLDEGVPSALLREISILMKLQHINIVRLMDVGISSTPIFLAFEYMDTDLRKYLSFKRSPLKPNIVKTYAFQLFAGINFIHSRRIIHRDIKPDNILLSKSGYLKLCDFGMARYFTVPMRPYTKGVVTLWYKAPELMITNSYDLSIDIWSAGCILFEMYTGKPLFPGDTYIDQLMKIVQILGTPSSKDFPGLIDKVSSELGLDLPECEKANLAELMDTDDYMLVDLIEKCLIYNPSGRITASEALDHAYFNNIPPELRSLCVA